MWGGTLQSGFSSQQNVFWHTLLDHNHRERHWQGSRVCEQRIRAGLFWFTTSEAAGTNRGVDLRPVVKLLQQEEATIGKRIRQ
jgi:hypothetical protein